MPIMMKKKKTLLGYYDDEIHDTIPTPNIEISDEDWLRALNENANSVDTKNKKTSQDRDKTKAR